VALLVVSLAACGANANSNRPSSSGDPSSSSPLSASPAPSASASRPTADASQVAETRAAAAVASVPNCDITGLNVESSPVISGSDMFILCALSGSGSQVVARVNLTTNKLVKTYLATYPTGELTEFAIDGGALWVAMGHNCIDPCTGVFHVLRVDLASGKVTRDLVDRMLVGVASSYVLVSDYPFRHDFKLDPATGNSKGQIPAALAAATDACGSRWSTNTNGTDNDATTTLQRLDANGKVLASFTEPGTVEDLQQIGNECWAIEQTGSLANPDYIGGTAVYPSAIYRFIHITPSGVDFRSPAYAAGAQAEIFDGTFWTMTVSSADNSDLDVMSTMQRIDPATWQPTGAIWTYTGAAPVFSGGGSLWAAESGEPSPALDRLDVPLGPIGS
jgi:hypothetical protein